METLYESLYGVLSSHLLLGCHVGLRINAKRGSKLAEEMEEEDTGMVMELVARGGESTVPRREGV
jgi:hypothetical protein